MFKALSFFAVVLVACHGNTIPEEIDSRNTRSLLNYYYYDQRDVLRPVLITNMDIPTLNTETDFQDTTAILFVIHGHQGSAFTTLNPSIKDAMFAYGRRKEVKVHVIVVDWLAFAGQAYDMAAAAVPQVGMFLADYIENVLEDVIDFDLSKVHIVGFGLGAHVAGVAGRSLGGRVPKITALDPSGNLWPANSDRLTRNDARFVEVIHTDGFGVLSNGIGEPLGNADFFVNGNSGIFQPGCFTNACSHDRAYELFAASLTDGNLIGNSCTTMLQVNTNTCTGPRLEMGYFDDDKLGSGIYRVNTGRVYPYFL